MKIRPKFIPYTIKRIKLRMLNKFHKIDFEGYCSGKSLDLDDEVTGYEACYNFSKLLRKCKIKEKDTFLDIGSGKGCALYYAKKFPFLLIDGIEISEKLFDISKKNIKKINDDRLHVFNEDARLFSRYDDYNYFYMFNPCKEIAIDKILELITKSYENKKRVITVIYQTPKYKNKFIDKGFKFIYENKKGIILRIE